MTPETFVGADGSQTTLIHFQTSDGLIACMPGLKVLSATSGPNNQRLMPHLRSGEPTHEAVTCPQCRKTQAFADAKQNLTNALAQARARRGG